MSFWDLPRKCGSLINDDAGSILFINDGADGDTKKRVRHERGIKSGICRVGKPSM